MKEVYIHLARLAGAVLIGVGVHSVMVVVGVSLIAAAIDARLDIRK
jgi:hypothetical protein